MSKNKYYKNTVKNVIQVFNSLKKSEKSGELLTVSKISKMTGLHKWTVSRTIDLYMSQYVDITIPEGFEDVGLKIKFVKLRNPTMTEKQVLRFLEMRSLTLNP
ncbi:MAG: hypothetical protein KAS04_03320 [Candidatus Aenigmarchaeota archaeon]|nr:hypothetical protein [Candidatus Aenigmarchaeota archaeon]